MSLFLSLAALCVAWADHGRIAPQLAGTTLCLDPLSVQVDLTGPQGEEETALLTRELRQRLEVALGRAEVRFEVRPSCFGHSAALLLSLDARYLDPETYRGFPDNAYTYVVTAQVGRLEQTDNLVLDAPLYGATTSDILSMKDNMELLEVANPPLSELAQAWRRDNLVSTNRYFVFAGLALLLVVTRALLTFKLRRKALTRPRPGRT